jgi:hypothetical protein
MIFKPKQLIAIVALSLTATMANAQVNKCTGADGRVVFSDQPCATGQKAAVMKPQASATVAVGSTNNADYKSRPEYPECLRLKNRLAEVFGSPQVKKDPNNKGELTVGEVMGGEKKLAETRKDITRYKEICGFVDKEGGSELQEKREREEKPQRDVERAQELASHCQFLRKELKDLRDMSYAIVQSTGRAGERVTAQAEQERKQFLEDAKGRIPALEKDIAKSCSQK